MTDHFYAVIMAGGGGTRLWPLSRQAKPKQALTLFGNRTMFQVAVDRLDGLFAAENIFVVTVANQAEQLLQQCPNLRSENFLIEPMPRGTASVVAMAALAIQKIDPQGTMVVLTADHFIENVLQFQLILKAAYEVAQKGYLVTLGIPPTYAATGYGYLESGEKIGQFGNFEVFDVRAYREKPDLKTAQAFFEKGVYSWNSGMFIWRVDVILDKMKILMPDLWLTLSQIKNEIGNDHSGQYFRETWQTIKPETIDYGIMEKSDHSVVLPAGDLNWNDVGSWDSIFEVVEPDSSGNIIINAQHIGFETKNSLICSSNPARLFVTIGMENVIIVDTGDALMICPRGESQKVKELVKYLNDHHLTPFL
ncbi:MAG: mannose-1-phosphate guanylyltransferase [Anaerolineaceae bacterium]